LVRVITDAAAGRSIVSMKQLAALARHVFDGLAASLVSTLTRHGAEWVVFAIEREAIAIRDRTPASRR
jgi:hypothetical protein